ncbi:hypothetical protein HRI_004506400 [Hibiscus trionum]|uniref:RNase H type-1 domain-containing protein n=1 Tax=Hibiscus trionum TaxID=183268 RepID=A0A9W7J835_HIBTR|nr:hypothetical protein HRI_004506400 [Hibiscus trionum]
MPTWGVELSEFGVEYRPQKAIKAQVLADFVAECTFASQKTILPVENVDVSKETKEAHQHSSWTDEEQTTGTKPWTLHVDELVVFSREEEWPYVLKFAFTLSNSAIEYEALVAELELAARLKVSALQNFTDSQLVAKQLTDDYEACDETLLKHY